MIKYRTISQLLKIFIIPEIVKRIDSGIIKRRELPFELHQFRIIQRKLPDGNPFNIIELNKEVNLSVATKLRKAVSPGDPVTLADINPEECFINPPTFDGKPAAYFLCQSFFFDYFFCFDCSPNLPGTTEEELKTVQIQYPIEAFARTISIWQRVNPIEKMNLLSNNNWPPSPGYFPKTLIFIHDNPTKINDQTFNQVVSSSFNRDYWNEKLTFWGQTNFFPKRLQYVNKAIDAHFEKDFISSIYVIVPQFEGVIKDYLNECGEKPPEGFIDCVRKLKKIILSRKILLFKRKIFENIFKYLETGPFWRSSNIIQDPTDQVNRHGILHGVFTGFECETISLKYLILLDSLFFVLLHDRMLRYSL